MHDFPSGTTDEEACVNVTLHLDGVVEPEEALNIQLALNDMSSVQTGATLRTIFIVNSDSECNVREEYAVQSMSAKLHQSSTLIKFYRTH